MLFLVYLFWFLVLFFWVKEVLIFLCKNLFFLLWFFLLSIWWILRGLRIWNMKRKVEFSVLEWFLSDYYFFVTINQKIV
jgi:hypothetical protein